MRIYSWGATDVGMKRDHNEDSYLLAPEMHLFVVADGMGGHAGGEMASGISVRTVESVVREKATVIAPTKATKAPSSRARWPFCSATPCARRVTRCSRSRRR